MAGLSRDALIAQLRAAWPRLTGADAALGLALAPAVTELPVLPAEHAAEVLLAWACVLGDRDALAELERTSVAPAGAHLRARGITATVADEAIQEARLRLLVRTPTRPPGLLGYRGRGSLAGFVRTTAARLALDLVPARAEDVDAELGELVAATEPDPGLAYLRTHYADALHLALGAAWGQLPRHDRFVLGLALHHRLGLDEIAQIYGAHRATAARKLASARAAFLASTRAALRDRLAVGDPTVDSILRIVTTSLRWQALAPVVAVE
ncbi:MAG: hypothetical protein R3B06_20180 [Kofleriaceae bacterium]